MNRFIFSLLLALLLTSCFKQPEYPIVKEGQLRLSFKIEIDTFHFDRIEAEGGNRPVSLSKPYRLPLNSSSDSTRYFFYSGSHKDTLTVMYTREFAFDPKRDIGYKLYLDFVRIRKNTLSKNGYIQRNDYPSDSLVGQIFLED